MYDAFYGVLYENAFILDNFTVAFMWWVSIAVLSGIPLKCKGARVAVCAICICDNTSSLELWLTGLCDCLCGGSTDGTIFVGSLQNRLTALLLMLLLLHWIIEGACPARWWGHSPEGRCVQLIKLIVVLIELNTGSFGPVLRNICHLLLFGQHLNLHLLLLWEGHEIIEDVFGMIFILYKTNCRHIFVHLTLGKFKLSSCIWSIPSIKILPNIRQVTAHACCCIGCAEILLKLLMRGLLWKVGLIGCCPTWSSLTILVAIP